MTIKLKNVETIVVQLMFATIIFGIGFLVGTKSEQGFKREMAGVKPGENPKSNDHRIVLWTDGKYSIQYYWEHPGWLDMKGDRYTNEAEARRVLAYIESPPKSAPTIKEILK